MRLLRPSWLLLHVLVAVVCVVMVRLGDWQWGRGEGDGGLRNYSYGLEWWAFAAFTLGAWVKFCRDETQESPDDQPVAAPVPVPRPVAVAQDDDDPELAAWNARLAELARRDAEHSR